MGPIVSYYRLYTKLLFEILNWQRELPEAGTYRFKYNAFVRNENEVKLNTFYSNQFDIRFKNE